MNTPKQNHYLQIGLGNKKHYDKKNKIGFTFEECPACKEAVEEIKFTTTTETGKKDALNEIQKWLNDEPSFETVTGTAAPAVKGPAILTFRLNKYGNNQLVLAKSAGNPFHYANRTQAGKKAAALQAAGIACHVTAFYPFYIAIEES